MTGNGKIGVILAHPDRLFREAVASVLSGGDRDVTDVFEVVGIVGSLEEVSSGHLTRSGWSILIFDFEEDDDSVRETLAEIKRAQPSLKTMVISRTVSRAKMAVCLECDIDTCLMKDISFKSFLHYLRFVSMGESVFPTALAKMLLEQSAFRPPLTSPADLPVDFSPRELAILEYLTEGASNKLIARHLGIADATVKVNVKTILRKINAVNRTQAAAWAILHNVRRETPARPWHGSQAAAGRPAFDEAAISGLPLAAAPH